MDLILRSATLPNGRTGVDIGIRGDKIVAVEPGLDAMAATAVGKVMEGVLEDNVYQDAKEEPV